MSVLIVLNVVAVTAESHHGWSKQALDRFASFELASVVLFALEYVARLWTCVEDARYSRPIAGRCKYALTPLALIDLFAILPALFLVPGLDARFLRTARLLRIARILKLGRYSQAMRLLYVVLRRAVPELIASGLLLAVLLVLGSSVVYIAERAAQPEVFSSISASLWWGFATLSTVGYGDIVPITTLGKLAGALVSVLGIGLFALPAGVITSHYLEELRARSVPQLCPHCNKPLQPTKTDANAPS